MCHMLTPMNERVAPPDSTLKHMHTIMCLLHQPSSLPAIWEICPTSWSLRLEHACARLLLAAQGMILYYQIQSLLTKRKYGATNKVHVFLSNLFRIQCPVSSYIDKDVMHLFPWSARQCRNARQSNKLFFHRRLWFHDQWLDDQPLVLAGISTAQKALNHWMIT